MPPEGRLTPGEITDLTRWIQAGAPWPAAPAAASDSPEMHWAFRPVRRPPVPRVKQRGWVRTPVDAFILARLEARGLRPAPEADRRTLIRRAAFDLTGLPPAPEDVAAFLADRAPGAWERLIERLLASPAYGERWGRHWLDVARYADSNGLDENVAHGNAWRYRDHVVRALNEDLPFDQFLREQLAGDLLPAPDPETRRRRLVATGFLALGPKVLAEVDKRKLEMDIIDEQIDTAGRAFMGMTLGCARCHDHKFDPISTRDYYALAGIFKSTRTMETLTTIARWWENSVATDQELAEAKAHAERVAAAKGEIQALVDRTRARLAMTGAVLPKDAESVFPEEVRAELKRRREELARLEKEAPSPPAAMGVSEGTAGDCPVHVRGSHLTLGEVVPRRFPEVMAPGPPPAFGQSSGRLQLAEWLASGRHPLTGRVLVNRIWRWHFGRGLVDSPDNFGRLGSPPSHPELLDWLAAHFVAPPGAASADAGGLGWSLKKLHRLIMRSSVYRTSSAADPAAAAADPENRLRARSDIRRLEAEALRDSLLAVSGLLDRAMGGSLLHVRNREFLFDHTSKDTTKYDSRRRSLYLPVIRNHLYDVFQLFDFADPAVPEGNRAATVVAPQALFLMNSDLAADAASSLAAMLLARPELEDAGRIGSLYERVYSRPPSASESRRARMLLARVGDALGKAGVEPAAGRRRAWASLCQVLLSASEFMYIR